jgi:hypothetical protein
MFTFLYIKMFGPSVCKFRDISKYAQLENDIIVSNLHCMA